MTTDRTMSSFTWEFNTRKQEDGRNVAGYLVKVSLKDGTEAERFMNEKDFRAFESQNKELKKG